MRLLLFAVEFDIVTDFLYLWSVLLLLICHNWIFLKSVLKKLPPISSWRCGYPKPGLSVTHSIIIPVPELMMIVVKFISLEICILLTYFFLNSCQTDENFHKWNFDKKKYRFCNLLFRYYFIYLVCSFMEKWFMQWFISNTPRNMKQFGNGGKKCAHNFEVPITFL